MSDAVVPFRIEIHPAQIDDLRRRLSVVRNTPESARSG
jgi:hypothetical protein